MLRVCSCLRRAIWWGHTSPRPRLCDAPRRKSKVCYILLWDTRRTNQGGGEGQRSHSHKSLQDLPVRPSFVHTPKTRNPTCNLSTSRATKETGLRWRVRVSVSPPPFPLSKLLCGIPVESCDVEHHRRSRVAHGRKVNARTTPLLLLVGDIDCLSLRLPTCTVESLSLGLSGASEAFTSFASCPCRSSNRSRVMASNGGALVHILLYIRQNHVVDFYKQQWSLKWGTYVQVSAKTKKSGQETLALTSDVCRSIIAIRPPNI